MSHSGVKLPDNVLYIIRTLEKYGYRADVVGGSVRDSIMGRAQSDFDLTTNAKPEKIIEIFSDKPLVKTGIKHGTVGIVISGEMYEVTTYRIDGDYKDSRHPEAVSFTSLLSEDLARRDFTVNALCYNPKYGYTDLFDGMKDIEVGIIRAVGDPRRRFTEDALRILRALRFASVLNFRIDEQTAKAAYEFRERLLDVSRERVYAELIKLIGGIAAHRIINEYRAVLSTVIPDIAGVDLPRPYAFDRLSANERLIALFYSSPRGPVQTFCEFCEQLKTDRRIRELGRKALECASKIDNPGVEDLQRLMYRYGADATVAAVNISKAFGKVDDSVVIFVGKIISDNMPYKISHLSISGNDLLSKGITGESLGNALEKLLFAVIDGRCENEKEALLAFLDD